MSLDRSIFTTKADAIRLNARRQLFLDDYLIAERDTLKKLQWVVIKFISGRVSTKTAVLGKFLSICTRKGPLSAP